MTPYIHVYDLRLGPITIHPFGLLMAIGTLVGIELAKRRGRAVGLPATQLMSFIGWMLSPVALSADTYSTRSALAGCGLAGQAPTHPRLDGVLRPGHVTVDTARWVVFVFGSSGQRLGWTPSLSPARPSPRATWLRIAPRWSSAFEGERSPRFSANVAPLGSPRHIVTAWAGSGFLP